MQRICVILLQEAMYDLLANVVLVLDEELAGEEGFAACDDIVVEVMVRWLAGRRLTQLARDIEPGPQSIVDGLMALAVGPYALVELYPARSARRISGSTWRGVN